MRTDILLDEDDDLIDDGYEWKEGASIDQDVREIVMTEKSEVREYPTIGFGIMSRRRSKVDVQKFTRELKIEIETDNIKGSKIYVDNNIEDLRIELNDE